MLIPLGHEKTTARRWPVITFGLILINVAAFLVTNTRMREQDAELSTVRSHILILAALHPELTLTEDVETFVTQWQERHPGAWRQLKEFNRPVEDEWDARLRMMDDNQPGFYQREMDTLAERYTELKASAVTQNYGFIPTEKKPITYLTANFLHGGWLHLIGNLWFLWLAGFVLEDAWGRVVYTLTYLLAGVGALQFHAWMYPGSPAAVIGASGAVAALMGAFLVRFPTTKIEMAWVMFFLFRFRVYRFKVQAYWLLPFWVLSEVAYGALFGKTTGVAHWAHVGGFACGMLVALAMKFSGMETKLDAAIESEVTLASHPEISQASERLQANQYDEAIAILNRHVATNPGSAEAYLLLQQACWRKGDLPGYYQAAAKGCELHLKSSEYEAAIATYDEFVQANGDLAQIPPNVRRDLCRAFEQQQAYDRALTEYQKLASACPDRNGLQAQLGAAKLCMTRLERPHDALRLYEAAAASPVPHLDLEPMIEAGIRAAKAALAPPKGATAGA